MKLLIETPGELLAVEMQLHLVRKKKNYILYAGAKRACVWLACLPSLMSDCECSMSSSAPVLVVFV